MLSRILSIPFDLPSCGPVNTEESRLFMEFVHNCESGVYSSLVGWVIGLGEEFTKHGDDRMFQLRDMLSAKVPTMLPRNQSGWAVCLYFLEKVCIVT